MRLRLRGNGVVAALGLAVFGAAGFVLPTLDVPGAGSSGSPALETYALVTTIAGGAFFLVLLVCVAAGRGWGPEGPFRPVTPFGPIEVLGVFAAYFLLGAAAVSVVQALGAEALVARFLAAGVANLAVVGMAYALWRAARWPADTGPAAPVRRATARRDVLAAAGLGLAVLPLQTTALHLGARLLEALGETPELQSVVLDLRDTTDPLAIGIGLVFVVALAPLAEETIFRGFLYTALRRLVGPWPAALGTAALFSAIHASPYAAGPLFVLGVALARLYERSGSLLSPIALHATFNALQFVLILLSRGGGS